MARSTYFDLGRSEDARPGSESAMPNVFNLKILSNAQFGREWKCLISSWVGCD